MFSWLKKKKSAKTVKHQGAKEQKESFKCKQSVTVLDASNTVPVSAGEPAQKKPWWRRLFRNCKRKKSVVVATGTIDSSNPPRRPATPGTGKEDEGEDHEPPLIEPQQVFKNCPNGSRQMEDETAKRIHFVDQHRRVSVVAIEITHSSKPPQRPATPGANNDIKGIITNCSNQAAVIEPHQTCTDSPNVSGHTEDETAKKEQFVDQHKQSSVVTNNSTDPSKPPPSIQKRRKHKCVSINQFGFPNIGQSCYMNASLQSLLSLTDFIPHIDDMEQSWSSFQRAPLMRGLMALRKIHASKHLLVKFRLLCLLKKMISRNAPEFEGDGQNDAHEFLTVVLDQMRNPDSPSTCPVTRQMAFQMKNMRTCKRCNKEKVTEEEYLNLSLGIVPNATVEELLERFLMEEELEYTCECEGTAWSQRLAFTTLPSVLMLHLKRFSYYPISKVSHPINIQRDIVVSSSEGGACYSLVSVISHIGDMYGGHYICDSVHPDSSPYNKRDWWLCFNDSEVTESSGCDVCESRVEICYILFYKKHVRKHHYVLYSVVKQPLEQLVWNGNLGANFEFQKLIYKM